jgi:hypothetical protein
MWGDCWILQIYATKHIYSTVSFTNIENMQNNMTISSSFWLSCFRMYWLETLCVTHLLLILLGSCSPVNWHVMLSSESPHLSVAVCTWVVKTRYSASKYVIRIQGLHHGSDRQSLVSHRGGADSILGQSLSRLGLKYSCKIHLFFIFV